MTLALLAVSNINAAPQDIILIIDNSGSMKDNDPHFLTRETVAEFVSELEYDQRAGLLLFGTQSRLLSDLNSANQLNSRIEAGELQQIDYRDMWTDTAAAIELALYELKMNGAAEAEPIIIILTDGIVDTGDKQDSERRREWIMGGLAQQAHQAKVRIFGIAFTAAADYELLQTLSQTTRGDYFRILTAGDISSVFSKINQQLMDLPAEAIPMNEIDQALDALDEFAFDLPLEPSTLMESTAATPIAEPSREHATTATIDGTLPTATNTPQATVIPQFSGRQNSDDPSSLESVHTDKPAVQTLPSKQELEKEDPESSSPDRVIWSTIFLALAVLIAVLFRIWMNRPKIDKSAPEAVLHDLEKVSGNSRIDVTGSTTRIGRDPGKASWLERPRILVFDNPGISRLHAILEYRPDGYWLADQNSKNGCKINYDKTRLPHKLQSGDKIEIAKLEFIFELPIAEETDETVLYGQ